jgi:hypothetical protein
MIITIGTKNEYINKDINTMYKNVERYNDIHNNKSIRILTQCIKMQKDIMINKYVNEKCEKI